ncbi:MAG: hypothetical protein PHC86_07220, partial [Eubacteriales bacterium]|nr:hypothetical protein [Eubacteriales bacterium]
ATVGYKYFDFTEQDPPQQLEMTLRGQGASGEFLISLDQPGESGQVIAQLPVACDSQDWQTFHIDLSAQSDKHALYFKYQGQGFVDFLTFTLK